MGEVKEEEEKWSSCHKQLSIYLVKQLLQLFMKGVANRFEPRKKTHSKQRNTHTHM